MSAAGRWSMPAGHDRRDESHPNAWVVLAMCEGNAFARVPYVRSNAAHGGENEIK